MPLQLEPPIIQTFKLEKADPTGDTTVTMKQATVFADEIRAGLTAEASHVYDDAVRGRVEVKSKWNPVEVARVEVQLTMIDCNILGADGEPLFKFAGEGSDRRLAMTDRQFHLAWGLLLGEVAREIHQCVYKVNPDWAGLLD